VNFPHPAVPKPGRWSLEPLGDQAVLATCRNEETARQFAAAVKEQPPPGVVDVVLAYHTVAVLLDLAVTNVTQTTLELKRIKISKLALQSRLHRIPCCYEMGEDLEATAKELKLSIEELIRLHTETVFTIFAIGFSPGFPYLGWLPKPLQGVRRRAEPRKRVSPGSVAIVGQQSCIYPHATPGGWALLGRTPLELVNLKDEYFPLQTGDQLQFTQIDEAEYQRLLGTRLESPSR
jgi:inhibitor of KinA